MARGIEVEIETQRVALPRSCAGCGAPPVTRQMVPRVVPLLGGWATAPYCAACARGLRGGSASFLTIVAAIAVSVILGIVVCRVSTSWLVVFAAAIFAAAIVIGIAMRLIPLRPRAAVETRARRAGRIVFFCANEDWGRELAERSGGTIRPPRRFASWPHAFALAGSLVVAPMVALIAWRSSNAPVLVDNATDEPLVIWVDGRAVDVVAPSASVADPTTVWVARGRHRIGHSRVGASRPETSVRMRARGHETLYNPRRSACYVRWVDVYSSSGEPSRLVAVPRRELNDLGRIDSWFEPNPRSVQLRKHQTRALRVAVFRYDYCTRLVRDGCSEQGVQQLLYCMNTAHTDEDVNACEQAARAQCAGDAPSTSLRTGRD